MVNNDSANASSSNSANDVTMNSGNDQQMECDDKLSGMIANPMDVSMDALSYTQIIGVRR